MQVVLILKFEFTAAFMTPGGSVFATIDVSPLRKKYLNCRMTFRYDIDRRRSIIFFFRDGKGWGTWY